MTGNGSNSDPSRRGSPADGQSHVHPTRPGTGASTNPVIAVLKRFDAAFSRTFTAMAMAEDGTRDLALDMLEGAPPASKGPGDAPSDPERSTGD